MIKKLSPFLFMFFTLPIFSGCVYPVHPHIKILLASKQKIVQPVHVLSYQSIYNLWSAGKQSDAEEELDKAIEKDSSNQRIFFFAGACVRSRL